MIRIRNKGLTASVKDIIDVIRSDTASLGDQYLKDVKKVSSSYLVTCPYHKDHRERTPSCGIFFEKYNGFEEGQFHCFGCGESGDIQDLVGKCFEQDRTFGEDWLIDHFGNTLIVTEEYLPPIEVVKKKKEVKTFLSEDVLRNYDFYHPYMWKRKLSKEVVDEFRVGYDKERDAITFPVYDEKHRLVMVTARSVRTKHFWIPPEVDKPVYLLYDVLEKGQDTAYVCESQINALYLRSVLNFPAVALFGTGSDKQFETLRRSGIRNYVLMYDGDEAGYKGTLRFKKNMPKDVFITVVPLPGGKDVNDLTRDEILWLIENKSY